MDVKTKYEGTQMANQHHTKITGASGAGAAAARAVEPVAEFPRPVEPVAETAASGSVPECEQIARIAYSYWQARGCPEGSPEEDWLRAEADIRKQEGQTAA